MEPTIAFINLPGGMEWVIILAVIIIIFMPKEGGKILRNIGQGFREVRGIKDDIEEEVGKGVSNVVGDVIDPQDLKSLQKALPRKKRT